MCQVQPEWSYAARHPIRSQYLTGMVEGMSQKQKQTTPANGAVRCRQLEVSIISTMGKSLSRIMASADNAPCAGVVLLLGAPGVGKRRRQLQALAKQMLAGKCKELQAAALDASASHEAASLSCNRYEYCPDEASGTQCSGCTVPCHWVPVVTVSLSSCGVRHVEPCTKLFVTMALQHTIQPLELIVTCVTGALLCEMCIM
jgi:hypothetical protein